MPRPGHVRRSRPTNLLVDAAWCMPEMLGVPWVKLRSNFCKTQVSAVCGVDRGSSERVQVIDAGRDAAWPRMGLAHGFKLLSDI